MDAPVVPAGNEVEFLSDSTMSEDVGYAVRDAVRNVYKSRVDKSRERKRVTEGQIFQSDEEIEVKEAPKVARGSRGKFRTPGMSASPRKPILGEADDSYDRALAGSVDDATDDGQSAAPVVPRVDIEALDAEGMREHARLNNKMVFYVCRTSGNLQGRNIKRLKDASRSLKQMVDVLSERTESEEAKRLSRENKVLRRRIEDLQEDVKAWKREAVEKGVQVRKARETANSQPPMQDWQEVVTVAVEKMGSALLNSVGGIINARFENIEDRLLPKMIVRPPLAGDKKAATSDPAESKRALVSNVATVSCEPASSVVDTAAAVPPLGMEWAQLPTGDPGRDPLGTELASWSVVARRQKKKPDKTPVAVAGHTPVSKPRPKLPAPPRSAAVVITLQPGAAEKGEDYRSVLAKVRERVSLADCGITELSLRSTATGSKIIEIPGPQGDERANSLACKVQEAVGDLATVARPTKMADIRVIEIDDSVLREEIVEATAIKGGCQPTQIKAGEIRPYGRGTGSLFMSLPVAAARVLVEDGRVRVGWSSARVQALEARPLRCFKCMGVGHTRPLCPSTTDRSTQCYRCGEAGHKAANCAAITPRCAVCSESGKPADHVMGGISCKPPPPAKTTVKSRGASTPAVVRKRRSEVVEGDGHGSEGDNMEL